MSTITTLPPIYVILGIPGSGKDTFAQTINYESFSTGNCMREEVKNQTEFGLKYKDVVLKHVANGIPQEIIQQLVDQQLGKAIAANKGIVLNGYPKNLAQCKHLDNFILVKKLAKRFVVLLLDVSEENAIERINNRKICQECNRVVQAKLSQCEICQGTLTKRIDAEIENTKKRVYEFKDKMKPVIDYYRNQSRLHILPANFSYEESVAFFSQFHQQRLLKA